MANEHGNHSHGGAHEGHGPDADGSFHISGATLIIEPVINFVPGSGPSDTSLPLYDPGYVNPGMGDHPFQANEPGEFSTYAAGYPPDPELLEFSITNNTNYDFTSLKMQIIGSAKDLIPGVSWIITPDPNAKVFFGDANGDGKIGISNIFSDITVSDDGKTLVLSGGVIPANGHFTDQVLAYTTDGKPASAGIDGSFDGIFVPPG